MPYVEFEIEVYCATCGDGLCHQSTFTKTRNRGEPSIRVEACQKCMEQARERGRDEGYNERREEERE